MGEFVVPGPRVADVVERIWAWSGPPERLPTLFPGTGAELVVHHGATVTAMTPAGPRSLPPAHLLCLRRERWQLIARGPVRFTAVRLRAESLRRVCTGPVDEVRDRAVPIEEALPVEGVGLVADVLDSTSLVERAARIEARLERIIAGSDAWTPAGVASVARAVRSLYAEPAGARVDDLARRTGLSPRQLRRRFLQETGVGPKEFQQLVRFQRVARAVLLEGPASALEVALAVGYYDHSHAIGEFRRFAGDTPAHLGQRSMSHFYYPRLERRCDPSGHGESERFVEVPADQ